MAFAVVVIAYGLRVVLERAGSKGAGRSVCRACDAAIERDAGLSERHLGTHADAAADQRIHLCGLQETGQGTVSAAVGIHNLFPDNGSVLHIIELELLGASEVLKDVSVFIGCCNSHVVMSFLHHGFARVHRETVTAPANLKGFPVDQRIGQFFSGRVIDGCDGGTGHTHPRGTRFLRQSQMIQQPNGFVFIQAHDNRSALGGFCRRKGPVIRVAVNPSAALFSRHHRHLFPDICQ